MSSEFSDLAKNVFYCITINKLTKFINEFADLLGIILTKYDLIF